jgi:uncharacterized protein (DUF924 family)
MAHFSRETRSNAILGRASTPDEVAFLQEPGSRFQDPSGISRRYN